MLISFCEVGRVNQAGVHTAKCGQIEAPKAMTLETIDNACIHRIECVRLGDNVPTVELRCRIRLTRIPGYYFYPPLGN